jgi:small-conductance mechanosensitive channel/CRP-like cAMP-binding protein
MMESIDRLRENLERIAPAWAGTSTTFLALLVLLALRGLLPELSKPRTRAPATFLLLSLFFRLVTAAVHGLVGPLYGVANLLRVLCLVVGIVGIGGILLFDVLLRRRAVPSVIRDLAQIGAVVVIAIAIAYESGFDPVSLAATGGVLTAVIGFALQSTIANLFAGVALPLEGQLAIGDWVAAAGHIGRIRQIRWRSTTIVTKEGDTIIVPNNQLITSDVVNYSRPTPLHRMALRVSIHYRHPPNEVRGALLEAVRSVTGVVTEPAPDCFPVELADSAVTYLLRYWISDYEHSEPIDGEVRTRVWYAARRAQLEIPYPFRTIVAASETIEDPTVHRMHALDRVDIFAPVDPEERGRLAASMHEQHFAAGEDIIRQDAPGNSLFIIARGAVEVKVGVDGDRRHLATLGPGQFFGEMSLMTGEPRQATCTAETDTLCYVIDQRAFRCVIDKRPSVAEEISAILANRQVELDAEREHLTVEARARRAREARSNLLSAIRRAFAV